MQNSEHLITDLTDLVGIIWIFKLIPLFDKFEDFSEKQHTLVRLDFVELAETIDQLDEVFTEKLEIFGRVTDLLIKVEPDLPGFLVFLMKLDGLNAVFVGLL